MFNRVPFNINTHISNIYVHHNGAYLWVGDYEAATDSVLLSRLNIKAILTVCQGTSINYKENTVSLVIRALDIPSYDMYRHFVQSNEFIQQNLNKNINVLVHCAAGISRSVTLVIAFLMKNLNLSFKRSLILVQSKRSIANPNYGFVQQLKKYQFILKQKRLLQSLKGKGQIKNQPKLEQISQIMNLRKKQKQKIRYQFFVNKSQDIKVKQDKGVNSEKFFYYNKSQIKKKRSNKALQSLSFRQEQNQNSKNLIQEDFKVDLRERIYKKLIHKKVETENNMLYFPKIDILRKQKQGANSFF